MIQFLTGRKHGQSRWKPWTRSSRFSRETQLTQLKVYLPITENIENTTVQHQMAGCQRGLSLSKLATHGYNNVITTHINT